MNFVIFVIFVIFAIFVIFEIFVIFLIFFRKAQNQVEMYGFLKGSSINASQSFHLTGFGDYSVSRIDILQSPFEENAKNAVILSQNSANPGKPSIFADNSNERIIDKILRNPEENVENPEKMTIEEEIIEKKPDFLEEEEEEKNEKNEENAENQSDLSYEEDEAFMNNMEEEK